MTKVKVDGIVLDAEAGDLKPCPFCGSAPNIMLVPASGEGGPFWTIGCSSETHSADAFGEYDGALEECIEAWNTRYGMRLSAEEPEAIHKRLASLTEPERTCCDCGGEEGTNGEMYDFMCSRCGFACDVPQPNYCPKCGARVV